MNLVILTSEMEDINKYLDQMEEEIYLECFLEKENFVCNSFLVRLANQRVYLIDYTYHNKNLKYTVKPQ